MILLVKNKRLISSRYCSSASSWKSWQSMRFELIYKMRDKYVNSKMDLFTKFSCYSRSTKFKDILRWNISKMISQTAPISMRIIKICMVQRGILICICWKLINTETTTCSEFINWESYCITNLGSVETRISRNKQIQKYRTVKLTASHIQERKLAIRVR